MPVVEYDFAKNQKEWQVLRNHIKQPENGEILFGGWSPDLKIPLPLFFQTMVDDILKWFNPTQGWKLAELRTGFISLKRIEQSSIDPDHPENGPGIKAKIKDAPDQLNPVFHFDADDPPLYRGLIGGKRLKFPQVFNPDFRMSGKVDIWDRERAVVSPDKIGSVFPLKTVIGQIAHAHILGLGIPMESVTAPYYLKGASVASNSRNIMDIQTGEQKHYEPPKSLMVVLFMEDLVDYLHLEKNNIRRAYEKLSKIFPVELPKTKTSTPEETKTTESPES